MFTRYTSHALSEFDITIWFEEHLLNLVFSVFTVIISLTLILIIRIITSKVKKVKSKRSYTVINLVESILKYLIIIITIFTLLGIWGNDVTAALVGVGIVSLVVGLGAQDLIKDLIAGIGNVMDNQYDVDEVVEINGFKGKVIEIGLRTTKLVNSHGEIRIIRNGSSQALSNFSRTFSVAKVLIDIAYKENIDKVTHLLEEKLPLLKETYPQIIEGPLVVGVDSFDNNSVTIIITAKTNAEDHYAVQRGLLKHIKEIFDQNNISVPSTKIFIEKGDKDET